MKRYKSLFEQDKKEISIIDQYGTDTKMMTKKEFDDYVQRFGRNADIDYDWDEGYIENNEEDEEEEE